jgi:hypothetical protein
MQNRAWGRGSGSPAAEYVPIGASGDEGDGYPTLWTPPVTIWGGRGRGHGLLQVVLQEAHNRVTCVPLLPLAGSLNLSLHWLLRSSSLACGASNLSHVQTHGYPSSPHSGEVASDNSISR